MELENIIEEFVESIETLVDEKYSDAWDEGFSDGYAQAELDLEQQALDFNAGVQAEQDRVQSVLQMMFDFAMNNNKMSEAKAWKNAMEIVRPLNIDYSDEAYKKSLEDDGF